jgi:hypothetical protein
MNQPGQRINGRGAFFMARNRFTACAALPSLLKISKETERLRLQSEFSLCSLTCWSVNYLEDTQPAGELLPGTFLNLDFASGFFEGKPRRKNNKQKPHKKLNDRAHYE